MRMSQAVYEVLIECVLNFYIYVLSSSTLCLSGFFFFYYKLPPSLGVIYNRKCIIQLSKRLYMYLLESTYTFYISLVEWASVQTFFVFKALHIYLLSCFSTITGLSIGTVIGLPLAGVLCSSDLWGGWPSVFYIFGMYIYTPLCIWNW